MPHFFSIEQLGGWVRRERETINLNDLMLHRQEKWQEMTEKASLIQKVIPHRKYKEALDEKNDQKQLCEPLQKVHVYLQVYIPRMHEHHTTYTRMVRTYIEICIYVPRMNECLTSYTNGARVHSHDTLIGSLV